MSRPSASRRPAAARTLSLLACALAALPVGGCAGPTHDDVEHIDEALLEDAVPIGARDADASTSPNTLSEAERATGWELLFDGASLDAWRNYKVDTLGAAWAVQDGCLARVADGAGDIVTRDVFGDFELQVDWRISQGGNSGIMFAVTEDAEYTFMSGPEMQVLDNEGHGNGLDPLTSAGSNYALHAPAADVTCTVAAL